MLTCFTVYKLLSLFLELKVCNVRIYISESVQRDVYKMLRGCVDMQRSYLVNSRSSQPAGHRRYSRRSVDNAIWYPSDFSCIRVLNSEFVGYSRCALGFRFPEKYAHQNDPLNQGNLHELKLRLKIVRYPGIEVGVDSY